MLELIVLGEVPGTNIVINFPLAIALAIIFIVSSTFIKAHRFQVNSNIDNVEEITL